MGKFTMGTKLCKRCGEGISHRHGNTKYCEWCAIQVRKKYLREYGRKYMKQFPKSARGKYYKYYKFLITLTKDELSALYLSKIIAHKEKNVKKREIKAQMTLINEAYKRIANEDIR